MYAIQFVQVHVIVQYEHRNQMSLERMGEKGNIVRILWTFIAMFCLVCNNSISKYHLLSH